jgi:predicted flap endonuclease-1-like 5' DNA nuclease
LLERCCTKSGRKSITEETGISAALILKWVNMADLFRISGVAGEYAELLECAGVDTVKELATRNADNLAVKLSEVNDEKKLTRRPPNDAAVKDWIEQAKSLPAKIEH